MKRADACFIALFFFQAEDGIRDVAVTGVQTCALPIFHIPLEFGDSFHCRADGTMKPNIGGDEFFERGLAPFIPDLRIVRSEERRVGKECRSRWSPYH